MVRNARSFSQHSGSEVVIVLSSLSIISLTGNLDTTLIPSCASLSSWSNELAHHTNDGICSTSSSGLVCELGSRVHDSRDYHERKCNMQRILLRRVVVLSHS